MTLMLTDPACESCGAKPEEFTRRDGTPGIRRRHKPTMEQPDWDELSDSVIPATDGCDVEPDGILLSRPPVLASRTRPDLGPCHLWTGWVDSKGYGYLRLGDWRTGRLVRAHRWVYEREVGPIPAGLEIDHLCRVKRCVNPAHLEPVTHQENLLRGVSPVAKRARQTHCRAGHDLADAYVSKHGQRHCRICHADRERERRQRAKEK